MCDLVPNETVWVIEFSRFSDYEVFVGVGGHCSMYFACIITGNAQNCPLTSPIIVNTALLLFLSYNRGNAKFTIGGQLLT